MAWYEHCACGVQRSTMCIYILSLLYDPRSISRAPTPRAAAIPRPRRLRLKIATPRPVFDFCHLELILYMMYGRTRYCGETLTHTAHWRARDLITYFSVLRGRRSNVPIDDVFTVLH